MSRPFVHLHTHSEYSLLDGLGRIQDLVAEARRLGQPALALTDHGVMHGAVEFFRAARAVGVQPIIGMEAYQTVWGRPMQGRDPRLDRENYHLLLLARDMTGYRNLLKISSQAHLEGYYYKPRVDHEFLAQHAEGLIATTGCLGAEIPQLIAQGREEEAYQRMGWYVDVFGRDHFFVELQEHSIPQLREVNRVLVAWARKFDLGLVVTNDVHYVRQEDAAPHEVLLCVQTGTKLADEKRMRMSDGSYYLKSREELEALFRPLVDLPASAFDNTLVIAEMCQGVDLEDPAYHLPDIEIPPGFTYETYLRHLTEEGLRRRYGDRAQDPEVQERKERELGIIHEMGFDVYFLIVADLCDYARSKGIWWNVRGSGAGSLVAYCIGITNLDPLKNNLIFERFLNPGRITMPDFDLDFPDDQREEMIRYTIQKYGADQVAQIVTFGRMKARAAVRDVGRVKDIPLADVDRIAKLIPAIPGKPVTIQDVLTPDHEFYNPELAEMYERQAWVRDLLDTAMQLGGVARHAGIHAAAVIVADRELVHYTPLMRGTKGAITETVTQYEFPILESIGLLKVDFLGLSTLTVLREACRLIRERHGTDLGLDNIPFEGEAARPAFDLLSSGEVSGVFQVESQGMRRVLTEMRPSAFEHIVATISLYRPGPMEYIPQFIRRMHGQEPVAFKHPALEPILAETYGICVYQEQIIQILSQLAGYTPGDADLVRRAISKKKKAEIDKHREIFIQGCTERGIPPETAASIYDDIEYFARYGFNKSHAADYAVITVQTAYLKALYPVEYMAALLLVERNKTDKVVNFLHECRRMGIRVLPPDVNYSGLDFEIQEVPPEDNLPPLAKDPNLAYDFPVPKGAAIRFGMAAVKNVGEGPVQVILQARQEGGPFTSLEDFCDRVDLRQVNRRALECLIKVGALDRFGERNQLLEAIDQMMARSAATHSAQESGQLSMFDLLGSEDTPEALPIRLPDVKPATGRERLGWEKELLGMFASSHPLQQLKVDLGRFVTCSCADLGEEHDGQTVAVAGLIADVRVTTTRKGDRMAFVQLEDLQGQCEVVLFPRTYAAVKDRLELDRVVLVRGKAQARGNRVSVLADQVQTAVEFGVEVPGPGPDYQQPLLEPPRINGVAAALDPTSQAPVEPLGTSETGPSLEAHLPEPAPHTPDDLDPEEPFYPENPFGDEMPDWMLAEMAAAETTGEGDREGPGQEETADEKAVQPQGVLEGKAPQGDRDIRPEPPSPPREPAPSTASRAEGSGNGRQPRTLRITFTRTGHLERDKYRLKEIVNAIRDPRGRDRFEIVLRAEGQSHALLFPNEYCTITSRLLDDLRTHFRVDVAVEEG